MQKKAGKIIVDDAFRNVVKGEIKRFEGLLQSLAKK
jgi:hypothetical protein